MNIRDSLCRRFDIDLSLLNQNLIDSDWDNFLGDKWEEMDICYKKRMFRIDDMPKTVRIEGRYGQLESFYTYDDMYGFNAIYFEKEKKFLSIYFKLCAYSSIHVESDILYGNPFCFPDEFLNRPFLLKVKSLFSRGEIVEIDDLEVLRCLFVLGSRNFVSTCLYLVDIKVILWVGGDCAIVYACDQEQVDLVRTVCTTEGLYFV
ncbi:hypothetical protein [Paenibacillus popilliae]|uniref:Alpha-N-acetylglucosamine transferase n=1 Tax=Paenibacillus popilliae ATCC 14706 TaxID=1212764 RepID=M9LN76_PAEPP|nr:hypothetical protein [Paenibacillus popilliae]GAC41761.1 alpha-N-acetylglucosamine transferase [Paenibacillus popilliae ATCC 14706]